MPKDPWGIASVDDEDDPWGIASIDDEGPDIKMNPVRKKVLAAREAAGRPLGSLGADVVEGLAYSPWERGKEDGAAFAVPGVSALEQPGANLIHGMGVMDPVAQTMANVGGRKFLSGIAGLPATVVDWMRGTGEGLGEAFAEPFAAETAVPREPMDGDSLPPAGLPGMGMRGFITDMPTGPVGRRTEIPASAFAGKRPAIIDEETGETLVPADPAPITRGGTAPSRAARSVAGGIRSVASAIEDDPAVIASDRAMAKGRKIGGASGLLAAIKEDPSVLANIGGSSGGSLAGLIALNRVLPGLSAPAMFALESGETMAMQDRLEEESGRLMDPLDKLARSTLVGGVNVGLEGIVPGRVGKALRGQRAGGAKAAGLTMATEAGTEGLQEVTRGAYAAPESRVDPFDVATSVVGGGIGAVGPAMAHMRGEVIEDPNAITYSRDIGQEVVDHVANL